MRQGREGRGGKGRGLHPPDPTLSSVAPEPTGFVSILPDPCLPPLFLPATQITGYLYVLAIGLIGELLMTNFFDDDAWYCPLIELVPGFALFRWVAGGEREREGKGNSSERWGARKWTVSSLWTITHFSCSYCLLHAACFKERKQKSGLSPL